jgi:hypothetical protein
MKISKLNLVSATLALGFCLGTAQFALAAADSADALHLDLPNDRLIEPMEQLPEAQKGTRTLEMGLSSWLPGNFSLPSAINTTSSLGRGDLPLIYLNTSAPLKLFPGLKSVLGLNFVQLDRDGTVDPSGNGTTITQTVDMLSARIGVEYTPPRMSSYNVVPYATLAVLPTLAGASRSAFTSGSLYFGVPGEVGLGARVKMKKLGIPWDGADFDLGVTGTDGTVDHSNIAGFGINAGVRFVL